MALQGLRLNVHSLTLEQRYNAVDGLVSSHLLLGAGSLTVGAVALAVVLGGLGVGGDYALEVAQHHFAWRLRDDVLGHHRRFATAAGRINHEGGHGVARGVSAQSLDNLDALGHGRAEVLQAH